VLDEASFEQARTAPAAFQSAVKAIETSPRRAAGLRRRADLDRRPMKTSAVERVGRSAAREIDGSH